MVSTISIYDVDDTPLAEASTAPPNPTLKGPNLLTLLPLQRYSNFNLPWRTEYQKSGIWRIDERADIEFSYELLCFKCFYFRRPILAVGAWIASYIAELNGREGVVLCQQDVESQLLLMN